MNKNDKKKKIDALRIATETTRNDVEIIQLEEQEELDNMPESLKSSERANNMQESVNSLKQAVDGLDEIIYHLEEATRY